MLTKKIKRGVEFLPLLGFGPAVQSAQCLLLSNREILILGQRCPDGDLAAALHTDQVFRSEGHDGDRILLLRSDRVEHC